MRGKLDIRKRIVFPFRFGFSKLGSVRAGSKNPHDYMAPRWVTFLLFFLFFRFLSENPSLKSRFSDFKSIAIDEINKSNTHPKRLVAAIENCVISLDDMETFAEYVLELGRRHAYLNSKPTMLQVTEHDSATN